jgi:hypothetical protein
MPVVQGETVLKRYFGICQYKLVSVLIIRFWSRVTSEQSQHGRYLGHEESLINITFISYVRYRADFVTSTLVTFNNHTYFKTSVC